MNHGCGSGNPLERVPFFDNKGRGVGGQDGALENPQQDEARDGSAGATVGTTAAPLLPIARRLAGASSEIASLPREFQETSLRVFVTSREKLPQSREAFARWSSTCQRAEGGRYII